MLQRKPAVTLPPEPIFGLTWSIPKDFGGLTNVFLHRNSVFARLGERRIDLLTLAPDLDVAAAERELAAAGLLDERLRLRNLWQDLVSMPDLELAAEFASGRRIETDPEDLLPYQGAARASRLAADGTELQVDTFRPDGTRLLCDRRDMRRKGAPGGRRLTLFTRKGAALASWSGATEFYFAWLDAVIGTTPSFLICDSQFIGGFLHRYRREHVTTVQVLHGSHLEPDEPDPLGPLAAGKLELVKGLRSFDLVTPLTAAQTDDLRQAGLAGANTVPIPNSRRLAAQEPQRPRDAGDGVVVSRLSSLKRIEHAVAALLRARSEGCGARLRIYGEGALRDRLQQQIDDADAASCIKLMGYRTDAAAQFQTASFSVLSSKSEGMALVLVESMAAGCIPIAYDVRYGPADIITHGVDGFLVPAGDVEALADAIAHVAALPEAELGELRANARARAAEFCDEHITRTWARALAEARDGKRPVRPPRFAARVDHLEFAPRRLLLRGAVTDAQDLDSPVASLAWTARRRPVYGRAPAVLDSAADGRIEFEAAWPLDRMPVTGEDTVDFHLEIETPGGFLRRRLAAADDAITSGRGELVPYVTNKGNLSVTMLPGAAALTR